MHSSTQHNESIVGPLSKSFGKQDFMVASCLLLLGLVTRIPFASQMIYAGDSARFAMAIKHYDVAQMRPHAPGYFLYVALAKFIDLFINDARLSLVALSILASTLTILFLYFLAGKMYGRSNGIIAALLLLCSPLFWFNGEIPFTYPLEGLFSIIFAYSCYKIILDEGNWLLVSAIILGLATGVRQNIIIMFLPLWLYAIRKYSLRKILISFVIFGVTCLIWFIPMVALSGGLMKYFSAVDAQFRTWVVRPESILFQLKGRWDVFSKFMICSLYLGLIPILYYFGQFFRIPSIIKDVRLKFLLLWFLPAFFFFIGVQVFNSGHVIVILPPLFIYLAESLKGLSKDLEEGLKGIIGKGFDKFERIIRTVFSFRVILISSVSLLLLTNIYIFLFKDTPVSYATIQKEDYRLSELVKLTKDNFAPEKSMIIVFLYNTQAAFYLPDYFVYCPFPLMFSRSQVPIEAQNVYISFEHQTTPKTYWIPTDFKIEPITIPPNVDTIILWEEEIAKYYQSSNPPLNEINSNLKDIKAFYIKVKPSDKIYYDYHYWTVR